MGDVRTSDWTMIYDDDHAFPFVEDENANITGLGHQDKAEFATAINTYDEVCNGEPFAEDEHWTADHISHQYAVLGDDGERLLTKVRGDRVEPDTHGAIAITTLWNQR